MYYTVQNYQVIKFKYQIEMFKKSLLTIGSDVVNAFSKP